MAEPVRIVCAGGGYVTIRILRELRPLIAKGLADVTVIDQNNYHTFHGLAAEMLSGQIQSGQIVTPARRLFRGAKFDNAVIDRIDLDARIVAISRSLDGRPYEVPFDHLVLALGSSDDLSRYPGLGEHAFRLRSYWDCLEVRNHVLRMLELAEMESDGEERRRLLTFVVAGGNYAGIEVATELLPFFRRMARKEYPRLRPEEIRMILVHSGDRILPELGAHYPRLVGYAERFIEKIGVEVLLNTRLASATGLEAITSDGQRLPTRTIISCTGMAQSPLLDQLPFERDERGRIRTDPFMNAIGHPTVWAGGDCAAVPDPRGGTCPPLAIYAMTEGRQIGRNIARTLTGRPLKRYGFTGLGDACSLGSRRAVGHLKGIPLTGFPAWLTWRLFMLIYLPSRERRVRAVLDWLVWPIVGRDIVCVQPKQQLALRESMFEPGQIIIKQGEVGHSLFIIRVGEVEVVIESEAGEERVATLGPGSHFGEMAVFNKSRRSATVRALERVRLLEVKRDTAEILSGSMEVLGHELRKLPVGAPPSEAALLAPQK